MLESAEKAISVISRTVWGVPMLILLMGCGVYFTVRLKALQITRFRTWTRETFGAMFKKEKQEKGKITPYQAVASALASSIGTGNIVGVATAISAGGAGAVFWMWVSAFFGMATKYAEIFLAVKFRREKNGEFFGGPMYYMGKGLGRGYTWLAVIFSISGAFACLGMGAMNQSNSIAAVMSLGADVPNWVSGVAVAGIAAVAISGGISRISRFAEKMVPLMAWLYILGGFVIIAIAPMSAWNATVEIFRSAFTPGAVYGGAAGEMARRAVRFGIARGVFSNEAGLGSAPLVHAAANAKSPARQGFWGMFEVFVDTIIVCTVTAVVIVSSGYHTGDTSGAELVTLAFTKFLGDFGGIFIGIATVLFALSTILGWSYYGERCVSYLTGENVHARNAYKALFVVAVMLGAILRVESVWELADMFNGIMMIPNLIAVILLSDIVIRETKTELAIK